MLIDKIRARYEAKPETPRGNPTGSRWGKCAAQTQLLRFPEKNHPTPYPVRSRMSMDEGNRVEAWWSEQIEVAFPNVSGLAQEPFYLPVPLKPAQIECVRQQIALRENLPAMARLWGTVLPGFEPPRIEHVPATDRLRIKLAPRDQREPLRPRKLGFVLDPDAQVVWAPTYVDRILKHADLGGRPIVLEKKALSNWAFRRIVMGTLDYEKRCQAAGLVAATNLDFAMLAYRKETAHLAELVYTRDAARVRVDIMKLNGQVETYYPAGDAITDAKGETVEFPGDATWEAAEVWTPFEPGLVGQIQERIRRVLLYDGDPAHLYREAGPDFTCRTCDGTGTQTLGKGTKKALKTPKPCEDCQGNGLREETELGFPCTYCPCIAACMTGPSGPLYTLTLDTKPHYTIKRADWDASGLTFTKPE